MYIVYILHMFNVNKKFNIHLKHMSLPEPQSNLDIGEGHAECL